MKELQLSLFHRANFGLLDLSPPPKNYLNYTLYAMNEHSFAVKCIVCETTDFVFPVLIAICAREGKKTW